MYRFYDRHVPVYLYTCVPVPITVYLYTCVPVYLYTCVPVYLYTCVPVYLCTCTYIHVPHYTVLPWLPPLLYSGPARSLSVPLMHASVHVTMPTYPGTVVFYVMFSAMVACLRFPPPDVSLCYGYLRAEDMTAPVCAPPTVTWWPWHCQYIPPTFHVCGNPPHTALTDNNGLHGDVAMQLSDNASMKTVVIATYRMDDRSEQPAVKLCVLRVSVSTCNDVVTWVLARVMTSWREY